MSVDLHEIIAELQHQQLKSSEAGSDGRREQSDDDDDEALIDR